MNRDVDGLAAAARPHIQAAVKTYCGTVLEADDAPDTEAGAGRGLLVRVFGLHGEKDPLPGPLAALASDSGDEDALASVELAVRHALAARPELADGLRVVLAGFGAGGRPGGGRPGSPAGRPPSRGGSRSNRSRIQNPGWWGGYDPPAHPVPPWGRYDPPPGPERPWGRHDPPPPPERPWE